MTDYITAFREAAERLGVGYETRLSEPQRRVALLLAREQLLGLGRPLLLTVDDFACISELQDAVLADVGQARDLIVGYRSLMDSAQIARVLRETDVTVVLVYRDPRDAALSFWYRTGVGVEGYVSEWRRLVQFALRRQGHPRFLAFKYEAFVREPVRVLEALLPGGTPKRPVEQLRALGRRNTEFAGNSAHDDVGAALSTSPVGRWRDQVNSDIVQYASWVCRREIHALGYDRLAVGRNRILRNETARVGAWLARHLEVAGNAAARTVRRVVAPITHV